MKYLPSYSISLSSPLDLAEILRRLKENVEPKKLIRFDISLKKAPKPFEGSIYSNSFFINKVYYSSYRFHPNIQGKLKTRGEGTHIDIKIIPDFSVWMFLVILSIILLLFMVFLVTGNIEEETSTLFKIIFPVFMGGIFPMMVFLAYNPKVNSARDLLINLFEAEEISPAH